MYPLPFLIAWNLILDILLNTTKLNVDPINFMNFAQKKSLTDKYFFWKQCLDYVWTHPITFLTGAWLEALLAWMEPASVTKIHAFLLPPRLGFVQSFVVVVLLCALSDIQLLKNRTEKSLLSPQQNKTHKNQWDRSYHFEFLGVLIILTWTKKTWL